MAQRLQRNRRREDSDDDQGEEEKQQPPNQLELIEQQLNDPDAKLTKKEIQKLQKKHEKEKMKDAMKQQREAEQQRRLEQEHKEEEIENKRKFEEELKLEEERKKKEEEEKKEQEEYNKWKEMFAVEEAGTNEEEGEEYENKLQQFIEFIEIRKVVLFEDLAAEFSLSTKDIIDRIQRLMETGRISGITDDRGKFIHITQQEFDAVARYIKIKGRVSKSDLQTECNRLVRMQPRAEDRAKIQQEQKNLLEKVEKQFIKEEEVKA
ncbi:UNKNOWN [Stylonychia lemnae]|uniref:DDRGK domain-containing protein 1 n=1 Tax=Stylonychia lemnae TaxID=5949 RepID=A0A078A737_STYLE|nr:UNKNOWN [Stylonychia lemnae]|eukprot:CDW77362.1 UNKNOWN [Stylonychia lemnae]